MGLRMWMRRVVDLLFPLRCIVCGAGSDALCGACIGACSRARCACPGCGRPRHAGVPCQTCRARSFLDELWALWRFGDGAALAVRALKYRNARDVSSALGDQLVAHCPVHLTRPDPLLIAVPMHRDRLRERGSNHAQLIADRVASRLMLDHAHDSVVRIRPTSAQARTHGRAERLENMRGAFACTRPAAVRDRDVLLIDDVFTTGATMQDCARALKEAGARSVCGITVARD